VKNLLKDKWPWLIAIAAYTVFILKGHNTFVNLSVFIMNSLTLPVYNMVVKYTAIIVAIALVLILSVKLYRNRQSFQRKVFYLFTTLAFMAIHATYMFEMNIEIIHSFEYAILALLWYAATGRISSAIVFSLPFMLLDEWYQYKVLYPGYVEYLELNDVLMDIFGAASALIACWIAGLIHPLPFSKKAMAAEVSLLLVLVSVALVGIYTCTFAVHHSMVCNNTIFEFSRVEGYELFWHKHSFTGATYHIFTPFEGMAAIVLACAFYMGVQPNKNAPQV